MRKKELQKLIIRRTERPRLNILSILTFRKLLVDTKMLKMFKVLKKIIRQNLSGLLCASTVSRTARAAIYMIQIIRIGGAKCDAMPESSSREVLRSCRADN